MKSAKRVIPIFTAMVSEDEIPRVVFPDTERRLRQKYLQTLRGKPVEVIVRRRRSKRSLDQNAYWHSVPFPLLADYLGYDADEIDELKFYLMGEWSGWRDSKNGDRIPNKMHTSDLDTEEGAQFTEWLIRFGAKLPGGGVRIPLPNEAEAA